MAMVHEQGVVVALEGDGAWVETQRQSTCQSCTASKGCGTAVLNKAFGSKHSRVLVANQLDARVGDQVVLGLDESSFVKGSFLVYGVPLLVMFVFALLGDYMAGILQLRDSEVVIMLAAVVGLVGSIAALGRYASSAAACRAYRPIMLEVVGR